MAGPGPPGPGKGSQAVRLLLLCLGPTAASLSGNWRLSIAMLIFSVGAGAVDVLRQRKRCLPFPIFLLLVWAVQVMSCIMVPFGLNTTTDPGGSLAAVGGTAVEAPVAQSGLSVKRGPVIQTMSIVMAAHNEHKYMKRTLDSLYEETPSTILKEIIVVDDGSSPPLKDDLGDYPQVIILRHEERKGLIKSKVDGGNIATGDSIMFLDAHVKPEPRWAEPLLQHMNINYKRVVVPLIPILNGETWKPNMRAVGVKMMYDWKLAFHWFEDDNDLVPCMSGGLFGITRQWWHESGEYDYGMRMWGAENIEQSIRIWLCGGEIYVVRESKISHVFRSSFPYAVNNTEIYMNKVRTVEVWFDEYKQMYYEHDGAAARYKMVIGDISDRLEFKKKMECKPFKWYVEKFRDVFERKHMLPEDTFLIKDTVTGLCLTGTEDGSGLREAPCDGRKNFQRMTFANGGQGIRVARVGKCVDANAGFSGKDREDMPVLLYACDPQSRNQVWTVSGGQLRWEQYCLEGKNTMDSLKLHKCGDFLQTKGPFEIVERKMTVLGEAKETNKKWR